MVLVIFVFSVSEDLVMFVALRTAYNAPRCHPNKGQLFVAIRCVAGPFRQGTTFRRHSMRRGAVQTRGNFPLPFNAPRCRSNKGQLSVAMQFPSSKGQFSFESEVVHLKSRFRARWAVVVCKNSFWEFLLRLTDLLSKTIPFPQSWTFFLDPKKENFQCS